MFLVESPQALDSDLSLGGEVFRELLVLTDAHVSKDYKLAYSFMSRDT